jgi:hypothetical protein
MEPRRDLDWSQIFTSTFTWAVRIVGLAIAFNEAFLVGMREPAAFGLAAFMLAGAQGIDELAGAWRRRP